MQFVTNGMHHTTSTVMVFQSDEYNKFTMIKGNRVLDMNKIKKILSDIDRGTNLLQYCPIIVVEKNKKLEIVDGQHRFMVAKKLKQPVHYIIGEALTLYDIAKMNSNTEKWKAQDFINCYVELGNDHYKKLHDFMKKYPGVPVTTSICLLCNGTPFNTGHTRLQERFHRGEFTVEHEELATNLLDLANQFEFDNKLGREFLTAIHKVLEANIFPVEEIIKKVNVEPEALRRHDHWRKYLANMEEIVGKGKQKRVAIY